MIRYLNRWYLYYTGRTHVKTHNNDIYIYILYINSDNRIVPIFLHGYTMQIIYTGDVIYRANAPTFFKHILTFLRFFCIT